ncbi:MAG: hypothetical protein AB1610_02620 [Nitrospirota bacterium]
MKPKFIHIITLFIVAFCTLCLELLVTKVLSFVFWNHIVYLIISLALLGYGISSTLIVVFRNKIEKISLNIFLAVNLLLFSFSVLTAIFLLRYHSISSQHLASSLILLLIAYLLFLLPFFFAGNILIYIFFIYPKISNKLYFWDLTGAALGCLLFAPSINWLGATGGILFVILISLAFGIILVLERTLLKNMYGKTLVILLFFLFVTVTLLFPIRDKFFLLPPIKTKSLGFALNKDLNPTTTHEYLKWDVVTRFDVTSNNSPINIGWTNIMPCVKLITFDGDAISQIAPLTPDYPTPDDIKSFEYKDLHMPFFQKIIRGNHLIIGVGGGRDITRSLLLQANTIIGVDINKAVIHAMLNDFSEYSGNIFKRPNVKIYHSEGRSFLKQNNQKYDLIQMTGVDTFTALNTGAYVLAENYLYTVEAIRDYYRSLSSDGILCIHRWFYDNKPRESLRLFAIMLKALKEENVKNPEQHIAVIRGASGITFMKKSPFTKKDSEKIREELKDRNENPKIIYLPWINASSHPASKYYYGFVSVFQQGKVEEFYSQYEYDVRPVTDNKPFFFNYYKVSTLLKSNLDAISGTGPIQGYWAYFVFAIILLCASFAVVLFIFIPLSIFKREGLRTHGSFFALIYFLALGLGFIMIEITLMQKFALFLGHPMYSIATVIGGMLLFAGIGSYISQKFTKNLLNLLIFAFIVITVIIVILLFGTKNIIDIFLGYNLLSRIIITLLIIAPLALALGTFFPLGLKIVGDRSPEFIPWAWGINSGFTVIGSIVTIILAMALGFNAVLIMATLIYLLGIVAIRKYILTM